MNELKEDICFLRKNGYSFKEIAKSLGTSSLRSRKLFSDATPSTQDQTDIDILKNIRLRIRRQKGELKLTGGARNGSGHSKSGYYKGVYCGSTYELCWVIYQLDHGKKFQRFPGFLEDKKLKLKYYPDFLLDDNKTIIELKGYEKPESVNKKTNLAKNKGYIVNVLRKEDLKEVFNYVDKAYNVCKGSRHTLFDDHKPQYKFKCGNCEKYFERDKDSKKELKFCSLTCSGKYRAQANKLNRLRPN